MAKVLAIETPTLGDRSYLAHDGKVAVVIDPQRDTDRITALAAREGVRITHDMWLLKRYGLPALYWNLMLRGRA